MKKMLAIAMCLALMMTSFVFVSAEADATITVGTVDGPFAAGDEVAIPITITEWANAYATIELELFYDDTLLELDAIEPSESDFGGAMAATNANKFSLVCNPSSDRQAKKLLGGEVCVIYFYAATDIDKSTSVAVSAAVKGYAYGKDDNWTVTQTLDVDLVNGGVKVVDPNGGNTHECVPADDIKYDENNHWYECRDVGCDKLVNVASHDGGEATCNAKAICSVCNVEYGNVDLSNHAGGTELRNESETYTGDLYCLSCNQIITQGEGTTPEVPSEYEATLTVATVDGPFAEGDEIAIPVTITQWENAYGSIELSLNYDKTLLKIDSFEASETDFSGSMSASSESRFALIANPSSQKQADKVLGGEVCVVYFIALADIDESVVISIKESFVYAYIDGADDNWTEARELYTNAVDGGIKVDNSENVECTHDGEFEIRNAVPADCGNNGYSGDYYCLDCQKVFLQGWVIPVSGEHTWDDGVATTVPTCIADGVMTYTCTVCQGIMNEYLDKDANNHTGETEIRDASEIYTGDTYCLDCNTKIASGEITGEFTLGDADGDGFINGTDAMLISRYYAGYDVVINLESSDVNGDGYVNTRDAMLIAQYYVDLIDKFPAEM